MSHQALFAFVLVGGLAFLAERGMAAEQSPAHDGNWPIQNGFNRQPNRGGLGGGDEFSSDQANEIDRLYDQLLSGGDKGKNHPSGEPAR